MSSEQFAKACEDVVNRTQDLDIRQYETAELSVLLEELVPGTTSLVRDAVDVLGQILEHYEASSDADESDKSDDAEQETPFGTFGQDIDQIMSATSGVQQITDLAFMARMELQQQQRELNGLTGRRNSDTWRVIWACGIARGRLTKALSAVGLTIAGQAGLTSELGPFYLTELTQALNVRKLYGKFRRTMFKQAEPDELDITRHLQVAASALAKMVGHDTYQYMRVADRMQVRKVQWQIISFLRGKEGTSPREGLNLWKDLTAFVELLGHINARVNLIEHDEAVLRECCAALFETQDYKDEIPQHILERLLTLSGLAPDLDNLLERKPVPQISQWKPVLTALDQERSKKSGGSQSGPSEMGF